MPLDWTKRMTPISRRSIGVAAICRSINHLDPRCFDARRSHPSFFLVNMQRCGQETLSHSSRFSLGRLEHNQLALESMETTR